MSASHSLFLLSLLLLSSFQAGSYESHQDLGDNRDFGGNRGRRGDSTSLTDDIPTTTLWNGEKMPLVGLSVENQFNGRVAKLTTEGLKDEQRIRLIDTSHATGNEESVAKGIRMGVKAFQEATGSKEEAGPVQVHVVTKVWYSYLGYERTRLSVQESLGRLEEAMSDPNVDLHVHVLLSWPRCYSNIDFMDCEGEEEALPDHVRQVGTAPHLDKENAWKDSWKALEEMYDEGILSGIGVSNFHQTEMEDLLELARVKPHIVQMNVWSLLNDPHLVDLCYRENIHIQVFDIVHGVLSKTHAVPHARHHLQMVANRLGKVASASNKNKGEETNYDSDITVSQVILKWLLDFGISVVPILPIPIDEGTLREYSAVTVSSIADLTDEYTEIVARSTEAVLLAKDLEEDAHVRVTFHADNRDLMLYYNPGPDEMQVGHILKGKSLEDNTHPGHTFRIYDFYRPDIYHDYTVEGQYGDHHHVHVDL